MATSGADSWDYDGGGTVDPWDYATTIDPDD